MGTHSPSTSPSEEERDECKGYVTLSQTASDRDSDFVLIVSTADMGQPQAIVETHSALGNNQRAVLLSLVPKFQMSRISPEIIFIADINGIMGRQLPQLRHALTVFLKTLTVGVKFNICTFGSSHSFLWPESMPYDKENLHTALKYVQTFEEDLRGIQILPPVEDALQKRYKDLQTEIIVLNHMPINYTESLLDFVRKECDGGDVRVFSLGIGSEANVEGLARAGRGYAHIVGIGDELDVEVLWMLNAALQEHVKEYKISFSAADSTSPAATTSKSEHGGDEALEIVQHEESSSAPAPKPEEAKLQPEVISLSTASASADAKSKHLSSTERFAHLPALEVPTRIQTPHRIPPLYPLCRTNVYVLLSGSEPTPRVITLWCHTTSGSRVKLNVPVRDVGLGTTVHHLAAKELLEELEVGGSYLHSGEFGVDPQTEPETFVDVVAREGWRVGSTFGVAGKWTNFVVVQAEEPKFDRPEHRASKSYVTFDTGSPTLLSCEPESLVSLVGMRRSERRSTVVSGVLGNRSAPPMWDLCSASQCSRLPRSLSVEEFGSVNELIRDPQDLELEGLDDSGPSECDGETVTQFAKSFEEMIAKLDEEHSNEPDPEEWVSGVVDHLTTWILQQGQGLETATLKALDRDVLQALVCSAMLALRFEKEGRVFHGAWGRIQAKINGWAVQTAGEAAWNALKNVWYQEYMQFWLEHGEEEDVYRERRGSGYYY
ncbi:hypothetical protein MPTK1_2g02490 [Marchantia polymorpha subsp. ruderalis]|uniref:VWFA domain-containing protein n=1 Tax=Marchantia polymorpha TaxID=3197 RepID=A0A2R6WM08_MARPO|nr:hypothetical protein MARPO_0075s0011 [Marchantia polymorpha]BBN00830.1 hypothetical protein Mp_2g02490 [Marchantia polymorpha subsp. ruderalis]|eukprot:PTQ34883.1 hypothetical protein MARPO_0075s0011 [Marchantia polymorpha]